MSAIRWTTSTRHRWVAWAGDVAVASVSRPVRLRFRHRGWSADEVLGRHQYSATCFGDDLSAAMREAERLVRERLSRLSAALAASPVVWTQEPRS